MLVSCCTNSTNYHNSYSYLLVQQRAVYNLLQIYEHVNNQIQPPGTTFSNLSDDVAVLTGHEHYCLSLIHI